MYESAREEYRTVGTKRNFLTIDYYEKRNFRIFKGEKFVESETVNGGEVGGRDFGGLGESKGRKDKVFH